MQKVVTTLCLILDTGKITTGICEALEILQWPELQGKKNPWKQKPVWFSAQNLNKENLILCPYSGFQKDIK